MGRALQETMLRQGRGQESAKDVVGNGETSEEEYEEQICMNPRGRRPGSQDCIEPDKLRIPVVMTEPSQEQAVCETSEGGGAGKGTANETDMTNNDPAQMKAMRWEIDRLLSLCN